MKTYREFIQFINESKETEWTKNLTEKEFVEHLGKVQAKGIMAGLAKHPMFQDFHFGGNRGSFARLYKHKVSEDGTHEVKTLNASNPTEHLHAFVSKRGKVYQINHNKVNRELMSDGQEANVTTRLNTFVVNEDGEGGAPPAMALGSANEVGTEDKTNVAGPPFKRKGIKSIRRNNKEIKLPKETV